MSTSFTISNTQTFTLTHAKYLSSKVATDLKRIQRFYGSPSDLMISSYETELTEFLKAGYLSEVIYGFKRDGNYIEPTLKYTARDLAGISSGDDDPRRVQPGANVSGAQFTSYLTYSSLYLNLTDVEKENFEKKLPFRRSVGPGPIMNGYLNSDKSYSSGGKALDRSSLKSY